MVAPESRRPVDVVATDGSADSEPVMDTEVEADLGRGAGGLLRSSALVAAGTLISRAMGILKTIAIAALLGSGLLADGYNLANTTPNMIYDLFLGGVVTATLVPIFVDHHLQRDEDGDAAVATVLVVALFFLTAIAMLAAPWIFRMYTWNIQDVSERARTIDIGVPLLRWFLPQILFYGLTMIASAMLNARRSYLAPAIVPACNNLVVLCMLGVFWRIGGVAPSASEVLGDPVLLGLLGGGTTAAVAVMAMALWPALARAGVRLRPTHRWRHPSVRRMFLLSGWTLGYTVVNQVALTVVLALAASLPDHGEVTAYTYAFMMLQLPFGLFTVSLMTTTEPELARAARLGDRTELRNQFATGLRLLLLFIVPIALGMVVLARPAVNALLGHAGYQTNAPITGNLLAIFALGLPGLSVTYFTMRAFFARKDTRTPFFIDAFKSLLNILLAFVFIDRWGIEGLVAAYSLAFTASAVLSLVLVSRLLGGINGTEVGRVAWRVIAVSIVMAGMVWVVVGLLGSPVGFGSVPAVVAGLVIASVIFIPGVHLAKVPEALDAASRLRARWAARAR